MNKQGEILNELELFAGAGGGILGSQMLGHRTIAGGPLNPDWVEWLMGWPIGHTDLKPSETDKSLSAEPQHGESLEALNA